MCWLMGAGIPLSNVEGELQLCVLQGQEFHAIPGGDYDAEN